MLNSILRPGTFDLVEIGMILGTTLLLGLAIAVVFKLTDTSGSSLALVLALLPLLVSAIIMIVNGNLGTSVAVLGAFGLVRFRSAPGSAREILFLFFCMAVGLAAGLGFLTLAALITAVVLVIFVFLDKICFGETGSKERELVVTIPEDLSYNGIFDDLFQLYTSRSYLRRVRTTNMGTMYELTYRIVMRSRELEKEFIDAIRCRNGNLSITLGLTQRERNEF